MKDFFSLNRNIQLRIMMTFIGVLAYSTVGSSMTIYYNQYMGAAVTGVLLIVSSIGSFAVGLLSGHLSDMHGRKPNMLLGLIISSTGAVIALLANTLFFNPWLTFFGMILQGFGYGFFNTGAEAMIVDVTSPENRKLVYSLNYWLLNIAVAIGSGISGWLFRDYLFVLLLVILLSDLLNLTITLFLIRETYHAHQHEKRQESNIFKAYLKVARDKTFMIFIIASVFVSVIFSQPEYYIPVHLSKFFHTTTIFGITIYGQRMLTLLSITNTLCVVFLMLVIRRLTTYFSNKMGFALGVALMGIGWMVLFIGRTFGSEMLGALINVLGELIFVPFGQALTADLMNPKQAGAYNGVAQMNGPAGAVLCGLSLSFSPLLGDKGMSALILLCAALAIGLAFVSIERYEQDNGKLPEIG